MARVRIAEFGIIQKSLAGASVAIYEADGNGESTGELATLYQASSGSGARSNPQTLDDDGKLADDCYVEASVVAAISNISATTERSIRKIRANPLEYPLPITTAAYLASAITAEEVAAALTLRWTGAWATTTGYVSQNLATNGGTTYICILAHTSGAASEPGVGGSWQTYWAVFAAKGSAGAGSGDMLAASNLSDLASPETGRANLGVAIGTNVQAFHANLTAFSGLNLVANKLPYADGTGTLELTDLTASGRALIGGASAAAHRATLELGGAAVVDFIDEDNFASNSATAVPSQQSVKAYVDAQTASPITAATQANQESAASTTVFVSPGTQQFHPSAAKFWVRSPGSSTVTSSYNVTSITDQGTGQFRVNIATDFADANCCPVGMCKNTISGADQVGKFISTSSGANIAAGTVSVHTFRTLTDTTSLVTLTDAEFYVAGFGDQ